MKAHEPYLFSYLKIMLPLSIPAFVAAVAWSKNRNDKLQHEKEKMENEEKQLEEQKRLLIEKEEAEKKNSRPYFYTDTEMQSIKMLTISGMPIVNVEIRYKVNSSEFEGTGAKSIGAFSIDQSIQIEPKWKISDWLIISSISAKEEKVYWVYFPKIQKSYNFIEIFGKITPFDNSEIDYDDEKAYPYVVLTTHKNLFAEEFDFKRGFLYSATRDMEQENYTSVIASLTTITRENKFTKSEIINFLDELKNVFYQMELRETEYNQSKNYFLNQLPESWNIKFADDWRNKINEDFLKNPINMVHYINDLIDYFQDENVHKIDYFVRVIEVYARDCVTIINPASVRNILKEILKQVI
jgi:hypothetical protein